MIAATSDLRALATAAVFALACQPGAPARPATPPPVATVKPIKPLRRIPEVYVRTATDIVRAPAEDQAVAQAYDRSAHGDVHDGLRMSILTARTSYRIGEAVRVLHVVEAVDATKSAWVMGPKPAYGEYVDGVARTAQPEAPDYPWVGSYDGVVLPGPDADFNFEITSYTFDTPGRHTIEWRLGALRSNAIVVDVAR